jgi:hypothetical protein
MRDEVLFYKEELNTRCSVCKKFRHSITNCPYIHLKRQKENVIHRHIRSAPNDRFFFSRKKFSVNCLGKKDRIRKKLRKIR